MNVLISSPSMHKVHHSRDERFADRNYGNIFTIWDRMFGTFVHSKYGRDIDYGVIGEDAAEQQTALGLLKRPFVRLSDAEVVSTDQMPGQPT
jgi:sterol desaturase/sphingolipid hydroxylase (fatty acid hydroxylase superfamily)